VWFVHSSTSFVQLQWSHQEMPAGTAAAVSTGLRGNRQRKHQTHIPSKGNKLTALVLWLEEQVDDSRKEPALTFQTLGSGWDGRVREGA
jgi:hypothetical protein